MQRNGKIILAVAIVAVVIGSAYATSRYILKTPVASSQLTCSSGALPFSTNLQSTVQQSPTEQKIIQQPTQSSPSTIQIVAAENFWGSLVSQLAGTRATVRSIVTDPNTDPHEYASNAEDARAIHDANYVIVNGAGYDTWANDIISAGTISGQNVLNVADLLGKKEGDNPHFWYGPAYVNVTVHAMYSDLVAIDPSGTAYYAQNYATLNASIAQNISSRVDQISQQFAGRRVASTESIFQYLASETKLDLISPYPFMKAVAEGTEPSPGCIAVFQSQLLNPISPGNATVLVYNAQTVSPTTQQLKEEATSHGIPVIAVTETIQPIDDPFQVWMHRELSDLYNALNPAIGQ